MPGVDLNKVYADPGFQALSEDEQREVLKELGYGQKPQAPSYGGSEAKLSPGLPESIWAKAREAVSMALFGSPDRQEAQEAGIGLQPTTAEMGGALATGAGMAAGAAGAPAAARLAWPAAKMAGRVLAHPATGATIGGASAAGAGKGPLDVASAAAAGAMPGTLGKVASLAKYAQAAQAAGRLSPSAAAAIPRAEALAAKVIEWKNKNGWSNAQIVGALRSVEGIPVKDGAAMVKMILGGG